MRASVLTGPSRLQVEDRPVPQPGPHEVLIEVTSVGVCGSDVHYFEHGRIGSYVVEAPLVLGHEAAGVVTGVGSGVSRLRVGQRVSLEPGVPDFTCRQCLAGRYNLCENMRFFATPPIDGAFAELVTLHEQFAHPVPDNLSDDAAALVEPLSVGLWACQKAQVSAGTRVLIAGAGPVGLLAAQTAAALGASAVTVTDVSARRLQLATELGATAAVDAREGEPAGHGLAADVFIDCSGHPDAVRSGIRALAPAGRAVLVGMGSDETPLPVSRIQEYELSVTGTFRYAGTWPTAIALAASGRIQLDRLVTGHYGLAEVEQALTAPRHDPAAIKAVVRPQT